MAGNPQCRIRRAWLVIAIDTNLLVYAHRSDADFHEQAVAVLCDLAKNGTRWAIPWPCVHEFISITTHPRIYNPPTPIATALEAIEVWLQTAGCVTIGEGFGYFDTLKKRALNGNIRGPMIHDARIAAICSQNGVSELWTADRDFSRFSNIKIRNPLIQR